MAHRTLGKDQARAIITYFDEYNREPAQLRRRSLTDQQIAVNITPSSSLGKRIHEEQR